MGESVQRGRRFLGYVPQMVEFDREFPINVWEVVQLGRLGRRQLLQPYSERDHTAVEQALKDVGLLHLRDRPISELSGGQRRRVYIARALASDPKILLLDEPLAGVDPQAGGQLYDLLRQLNQRMTILLISHDIGAIAACVKTVGCLNRRLYYHGQKEITAEMLELAYECPIDLIAHGVPHRVLAEHAQNVSAEQEHKP